MTTALITHGLAFLFGAASVWLLAICAAGGRADDWLEGMEGIEGDGLETDAMEAPPPVRMEVNAALTDAERDQLADDVIRAFRRAGMNL